MENINLMDLTIPETETLVAGFGEPKYRAKQIYKWVHQKGAACFDEMTDLPQGLRDKLRCVSSLGVLEIITKNLAADGTAKYLLGLSDKHAVETVFLPHEYGNSICVSSQVGCRMGCRFCASTLEGLVRNLTAGEIYAQVTGVQADAGERISSIVIMGSGEPMDNLAQVVRFIGMITSPEGLNIGARHITLSTCGVVPGIRELAREKLQITLSVSLHAPDNDIRNQIMPINRRYPIEVLMEACGEYTAITTRRVTFEYALIDGFNDSPGQARQLAGLLKGTLCHVNLIPLNEVKERLFKRSDPVKVRAFKDILEKNGIPATIRREMGTDIDAACGQLRRRVMEGQAGPERR